MTLDLAIALGLLLLGARETLQLAAGAPCAQPARPEAAEPAAAQRSPPSPAPPPLAVRSAVPAGESVAAPGGAARPRPGPGHNRASLRWTAEEPVEAGPGEAEATGAVALPGSTAASGGPSNAVTTGSIAGPGGELAYYEVTMTITATGWPETFVVYVPTPVPAGPRPLLVVFHKFGSSQRDVLVNTTYVQEAASRGWFLVAPLSAHKMHFSSLEGQAHTEAVLDWMDATFPIDRQRIYAVGFSMGGGAVTSYAARHLDPARPMIAALVDHTGTVDLGDVYLNDPPARFIFDFWYGDGSAGSADPWRMARSSVLRFDDATLAVDELWSLDRNLLHVPMRLVRASDDPIAYLPRQCDVLDGHLQALGVQPGSRYGYEVISSATHSWDLLDEGAACDWLAQHSLELPASGRALLDRDGTAFHFTVEQARQDEFTAFAWSVDAAGNALQLLETQNLARAAVDLGSARLDSRLALDLSLAGAAGSGTEFVLRPYPQPPSSVLRDGVAVVNWSWRATRRELVLDEGDAGEHLWQVLP